MVIHLSLIQRILFVCICSTYSLVIAEEHTPTKICDSSATSLKERQVVTHHTIVINQKPISYQTTAGTQILKDEKGVEKASFFYVAYSKEGGEQDEKRPLTFCFNGGPGSSSVWLHIGAFGPKRVLFDPQGVSIVTPFQLVDNPYSLLDVTDLVFIDPISTGHSRASTQEDPKQYYHFEKDIETIAQFIRLYVTRNQRWLSPKFVMGESYGGLRATGLAQVLHDQYYLYLDGVILISGLFNYQLYSESIGNDLPYILALPSLTAASLYHQKLAPSLQENPKKTLELVEAFALGEYSQALMKGDRLSPEQKKNTLKELEKYTGLPQQQLDLLHLRVAPCFFYRALLKNQEASIGRFDSRVTGVVENPVGQTLEFDPSFEILLGPFTALFNEYLRKDLQWIQDDEYRIMTNVWPWDFGAKNEYLNLSEQARDVMSKNSQLRFFVATGIHDLALPYFATQYSIDHLYLAPSIRSHVSLYNYEGGHMMYFCVSSLEKLKKDLLLFYLPNEQKP